MNNNISNNNIIINVNNIIINMKNGMNIMNNDPPYILNHNIKKKLYKKKYEYQNEQYE